MAKRTLKHPVNLFILKLTRLLQLLPVLFLAIFILTVSALAQNSAPVNPIFSSAIDTSSWGIYYETIFDGDGNPVNYYVEELLEQLKNQSGPGVPLSLIDFKRLVITSPDPTVYAKQLIKYAMPHSKKIQDGSHESYLKRLVEEDRQQEGICFLIEHQDLFRSMETNYGIHPKDVLAILMWESALGKYTGSYRIFNVFMGQILYLEQAEKVALLQMIIRGDSIEVGAVQRKKRLNRIRMNAVKNLSTLLRISKEKDADPFEQLGSWGGAIGFVQFIPASLKFAVDADQDGHINLKSWPDAIYSVANYLKLSGYKQTEGSRRRAILAYNHLDSYVKGVITYADLVWERFEQSGGFNIQTPFIINNCQSSTSAK